VLSESPRSLPGNGRSRSRKVLPRVAAVTAAVILTGGMATALALRTAAPASATPRSQSAQPSAARPLGTVASQGGQLAAYLRFTGTGTMQAKPDTATLQFTTVGNATSLSAAQNQASARMTTLLAAFQKAGIAKGDLATGSGWAGTDGEHPGRYTASQDLTVTVRDLSRAGALLALGTDNGASSSYGPSFSLQDVKAFYTAALRAAIDNARAKADAAASLIGATVTGVVSIDEQGGGQPPILELGARAPGAAGGTNPVPVVPGTQQVSASVTVVFSYSRS